MAIRGLLSLNSFSGRLFQLIEIPGALRTIGKWREIRGLGIAGLAVFLQEAVSLAAGAGEAEGGQEENGDGQGVDAEKGPFCVVVQALDEVLDGQGAANDAAEGGQAGEEPGSEQDAAFVGGVLDAALVEIGGIGFCGH
jgi:hypothetical protein